MKSMTLRTYPKINLSLDVTGVRDDGYHEVEMIMQSIRLFDIITVTVTDEHQEIKITSNKFYVPCDNRNTVYKATEYFFEEFPYAKCGVEIHIQKRIPVAAGIAGGSSNAAGVLKALNKLCGVNAGKRKLMKIGEKVGADVPYCILGGTVVARGIGCDLERISNAPTMTLCIAKPNFSVSTPEVYKELDDIKIKKHPDTNAMINAIENEDVEEISNNLLNVLEEVTAVKHPIIEEIKQIMKDCGALNAVMSGSGPTVFGIFKTAGDAYKAKESLKKIVRFAEVTKTKV